MKMMILLLLFVSQHASGVEVYEGVESVLLPCRIQADDSRSPTAVLWRCDEFKNPRVHVRLLSADNLQDQNVHYVGRTSMRADALQTGDFSLTLRNPTVFDSGTYTCITLRSEEELSWTEVQLKVTERPPPVWPTVLSVVLLCTLIILAAAYVCYLRMRNREEGWGSDLWKCGGDGYLRWSGRVSFFSGLFLVTAAGVCVLLLSGLAVPADAPPLLLSESVLRLLCHLVVLCPYCISTGLLLSIYSKTLNKPAVSMEMTQHHRGQGLDDVYDDINAYVTTEHAF
ncbi:unnamed protein product [Oreochromis niloticus]|nr:unnamed protein product [Mustela putorius furo]